MKIAEDFRKEAAYEGGWQRPKTVTKRLNPGQGAQVIGDKIASEVDAGQGGYESDEAMEDNGFDDGEGGLRDGGAGNRGSARNGLIKGELPKTQKSVSSSYS